MNLWTICKKDERVHLKGLFCKVMVNIFFIFLLNICKKDYNYKTREKTVVKASLFIEDIDRKVDKRTILVEIRVVLPSSVTPTTMINNE